MGNQQPSGEATDDAHYPPSAVGTRLVGQQPSQQRQQQSTAATAAVGAKAKSTTGTTGLPAHLQSDGRSGDHTTASPGGSVTMELVDMQSSATGAAGAVVAATIGGQPQSQQQQQQGAVMSVREDSGSDFAMSIADSAGIAASATRGQQGSLSQTAVASATASQNTAAAPSGASSPIAPSPNAANTQQQQQLYPQQTDAQQSAPQVSPLSQPPKIGKTKFSERERVSEEYC